MSQDRPLPIAEHLRELGKRLKRVIIAFVIGFLIGWLPSPGEFKVLLNPSHLAAAFLLSEYKPVAALLFRYVVIDALPRDIHVATLGLLTPLEVLFYICTIMGIIVAFPVLLREIYLFLKPGLYKHEVTLMRNYLLSGTVLFIGGVIFGYLVVFRALIRLYVMLTPWIGLEKLLLVRNLLNELLGATVFSGILFETPIIMLLLAKAEIVNPSSYIEYRPIVYAIAILLICIFNPDPTFLSSLIWITVFIILYEIGIILSKRAIKRHGDDRYRRPSE